MRFALYFLVSLSTVALPLVVEAAPPATYKDLVVYIVKIMNYTIGTLVILGLVFYLYGVARNIMKAKDGEANQSRKFLLMGIVILFVMVSIWGILEILQNTFLSGGVFDPAAGEESQEPCAFGDPNCSIDF